MEVAETHLQTFGKSHHACMLRLSGTSAGVDAGSVLIYIELGSFREAGLAAPKKFRDPTTSSAEPMHPSVPDIAILLSRRAVIAGISAGGAAFGLGGCAAAPRTKDVDPAYLRKVVNYDLREAPGTIIVDPRNHYLYLVQRDGQALRYGVGVGGEGFGWSGVSTVQTKQEWPDWYPPQEMLLRKPELRQAMSQLQSGLGMPGGPANPLGARALYLWQGKKDTLYRIHGTNEPWTIGHNVSSGCIRMTNDDVVDLYDRTPIGAKVTVLPTA